MLRSFLFPLLLAAPLLAPSSTWADETREEPPTPPPHPGEWYGSQTLTTDVAATGLVVAGIGTAGRPVAPTLAWSGLGTFALGGPIVHAAHGHWGMAGADLGLRVGSVAVGAFVGGMIGKAAQAPSCNGRPVGDICIPSGDGLYEGVFLGGLLGAVTASAIDSAALAREPKAESDTARFTWSPTLAPLKGGVTVGLTGRL